MGKKARKKKKKERRKSSTVTCEKKFYIIASSFYFLKLWKVFSMVSLSLTNSCHISESIYVDYIEFGWDYSLNINGYNTVTLPRLILTFWIIETVIPKSHIMMVISFPHFSIVPSSEEVNILIVFYYAFLPLLLFILFFLICGRHEFLSLFRLGNRCRKLRFVRFFFFFLHNSFEAFW